MRVKLGQRLAHLWGQGVIRILFSRSLSQFRLFAGLIFSRLVNVDIHRFCFGRYVANFTHYFQCCLLSYLHVKFSALLKQLRHTNIHSAFRTQISPSCFFFLLLFYFWCARVFQVWQLKRSLRYIHRFLLPHAASVCSDTTWSAGLSNTRLRSSLGDRLIFSA